MGEKTYAINVNGREKTVAEKNLTYAEVVALAYGPPPYGEKVIFTITYKRGEGNKPEGTLVEGDELKVKEGMIINVIRTDKS